MQTEDGLKSTLTQQVSKALLQSKIVDRDIDNIREAQIVSLFNISSITNWTWMGVSIYIWGLLICA